jgi:8-oxo-dGTP diphosphatase
VADVVDAAGGVIWRLEDSGLELLLIHRPDRDDWSLPKGKRDDGESFRACALREVEEETGFRCKLGPQLGETHYTDRKGRPKRVRYWAMTVRTGRFEPNVEVDEIRWCRVDDVERRLTQRRDVGVVAALVEALEAV